MNKTSYSAIDIRIEGDEELLAQLSRMQGPYMDALLRRALMAGAKQVMVPTAKGTAPISPTLGGSTMKHRTYPGDLVKAIKAKDGRKGLPPAAIITPGETYWYSKWVVMGTKEHRIRFPDQKRRGVPKEEGNIVHPGNQTPNPFWTRAGKQGTPGTLAVIKRYITAYIDDVSRM